MATRYDDKGKIFTNVVAKEAITVYIQTSTQRIFGIMYVREGQRIKDELNLEEKFLAVTDAVVYDANGAVIFETSFLAVNRNQIIWVIPESELYVEAEGNRGGE